MNPKSNSKDLPPAQDRLADALIAEHARLGKDADEELISNIMLNTVNAPVDISAFSPSSRSAFTPGDWAKVAAVVIAIVSIGVLTLNRLGSGENHISKGAERKQETFHLVVNYVEPAKGSAEEPRANRKVLVSAQPGSNRFEPVSIGSTKKLPSFEIAETDLAPPVTKFGQSIDEFPDLSNVKSSFRLASNDTTATRDKVIYSGDVVLSHTKFILKADSLVISKFGDSGEGPLLKALNAKLSHRKGHYETEADAISFDPLTGELVARGVQSLYSQGVEQPVINRASTIVFGDEEFFIEERFARPY